MKEKPTIYKVEAATDPYSAGGSIWIIAYATGDINDVRTYFRAKHRDKSYHISVSPIEIKVITPDKAEKIKDLEKKIMETTKSLKDL